MWPDALRVASIFAVVLLHSAAPLLARHRPGDAAAWWAGNAWDAAVRWCVPLFVMLSGALLLGRDEPLGRFFARRLQRVAVPLAAWSLICFLWADAFHDRPLDLADLPRLVLDGPVYYHLWFFHMVLGLYLLTPLANAYLRATGSPGGWALVALWAAWVGWIFAKDLGGPPGGDPPPDLSPLRYLGYFVLGRLLRDVQLGQRPRFAAAALFLAAWAVTAAGTWWLSVERGGGRFDGTFYAFTSPNVLVMSVSVFLLGKSLPMPRESEAGRARRWLRVVCTCVLGVYLVHVLVLEVLKSGRLGIELDERLVHPAAGVPLFALAVGGLSLAIVLVLKRIPLLSRVVP